jgi:hypothetical protein
MPADLHRNLFVHVGGFHEIPNRRPPQVVNDQAIVCCDGHAINLFCLQFT